MKSETRLLKRSRCLGVGGLILAIWLATAVAASAQTFKTLVNFDGTNGGFPEYMSLVQGEDGYYYGTTEGGGPNGGPGTVFKISPNGNLTTVYSFSGADGGDPYAGLIVALDGNFYGTTTGGGANGYGTVFKISAGGNLSTLYSFCAQNGCADGEEPIAVLVQAADGNFYGTTLYGGDPSCNAPYGCGAVFKMTPSGAMTTLHSFAGYPTDGALPSAGLIQATDGQLYGTTWIGGSGNGGTFFRLSLGGKLTIVHSFSYADGLLPHGRLVQAADGALYGTTGAGGTNGAGTVFRATLSGKLTTLYSFCSQNGCADGGTPYAGLVQGTDGNFYGTTTEGADLGCNAPYGCGAVFKITPGGNLTTLQNFDASNGSYSYGELLQATNGMLYGTTCLGGTYGQGTVFSLFTGLRPFVTFVSATRAIGQSVGILGQGFTGTINVAFNGTPAGFTVIRDTFLKATVPAGATTGPVTVTTPSGTLTSNVPFRVKP